MLKKSLQALTLGCLISTAVVAALPSRTHLANGFSFGINTGYQFNHANRGGYTFSNFNAPEIGAHFDYNKCLSSVVFWGIGAEINHPLKTNDLKVTGTRFKIRRELGGAIVARLGTTASNAVAFDFNVAALGTNWKTSATSPTSLGGTRDFFRFGAGPGVNVTFAVTEKFSVGVGYRYEVYPRASDAPTFTSHRLMAKFSFHL